MADKYYISAQELFEDSLRLGALVMQSDFKPNYIVGIWRGGTPVGITVQELLHYCGTDTDHIAIRTSSYRELGERQHDVQVHGLGYLVRNLNAEDRLLIIDDVYDTGLSIDATIKQLKERTRRNTPGDIRIATPWYKPANNRTQRVPDYYLHETDRWLVFPHEIDGLSQQEIRTHKPAFAEVLDSLNTFRPDKP